MYSKMKAKPIAQPPKATISRQPHPPGGTTTTSATNFDIFDILKPNPTTPSNAKKITRKRATGNSSTESSGGNDQQQRQLKRVRFIDKPSLVAPPKPVGTVPKTQQESSDVIKRVIVQAGLKQIIPPEKLLISPRKVQQAADCGVCKLQWKNLKLIAQSCQLRLEDEKTLSCEILSKRIVSSCTEFQKRLQDEQQNLHIAITNASRLSQEFAELETQLSEQKSNVERLGIEKDRLSKLLIDEKRTVAGLKEECRKLTRFCDDFVKEERRQRNHIQIQSEYSKEIENLYRNFWGIQDEFSKRIRSIPVNSPSFFSVVEYGRRKNVDKTQQVVPTISVGVKPSLSAPGPARLTLIPLSPKISSVKSMAGGNSSREFSQPKPTTQFEGEIDQENSLHIDEDDCIIEEVDISGEQLQPADPRVAQRSNSAQSNTVAMETYKFLSSADMTSRDTPFFGDVDERQRTAGKSTSSFRKI